jgi:hypothetical protein
VRRRSAFLAAAFIVAAILLLTLWPLPDQGWQARQSPLLCLICGDQGAQDVFQNLLMLIPLGLVLGLGGVRPRMAALLAFLLSFAVETLQYTVATGRDASLSDVITNTAGAALGAWLVRYLPHLLRPSQRAARPMALAAVLLWAGAWLFGAWAISTDPGRGGWRGRVANDLPGTPPFNGEVVAAFLDGTALAVVPAALPPEVEQAFARDSFVLEGSVRPGPPIALRENIVTVIDTPAKDTGAVGNLVMVFNRAATVGTIGFRLNAARLRLRTPTFFLGRIFNVPVDEEVRFHVARSAGLVHASAQGVGPALVAEYRLGPELLWSVLAPRSPRPTTMWNLEAFLWAAALLGISGFWGARSGSAGVLAIAFLIAVVVQLGVPRLQPVSAQSPLGWSMLLGGLLLGAVAGHRSIRPAPVAVAPLPDEES